MWMSTRQVFAPRLYSDATAQVVFCSFFGSSGGQVSNGLSRITSHVKISGVDFGTHRSIISSPDGGGGAGSAAVVLGLAAVRRCLGVDVPIREGRTDSLGCGW